MEGIMKNVGELYENHYSAYKNDYDASDELTVAKKKKFNSSNCLMKQMKSQSQMKKQKDFLRRLNIKKRELIKGDLQNILAKNLLRQ